MIYTAMSQAAKSRLLLSPLKANKMTVKASVKGVETPMMESEKVSSMEEKQKRLNISEVVGIHIAPARVRRHIDKLGLNQVIDPLVAELRMQTNSYDRALKQLELGTWKIYENQVDESGKKTIVEVVKELPPKEVERLKDTVAKIEPIYQTLKLKISALAKERIRFSNDASVALAVVCEELLEQMINHTMEMALASKKKTIRVAHLFEPGVEKLSLYPLFCNLPSYAVNVKRFNDEYSKNEMGKVLKARLVEAEQAFRVKYAYQNNKVKAAVRAAVRAAKLDPPTVDDPLVKVETVVGETTPVEVVEVPPVDGAAETSDDDGDENPDKPGSKTSFKHYIKQVCDEMKKKYDCKYKLIKVSKEIKDYLSSLVVEFIQRISRLVVLTTLSMKNKTVKDVTILRTIESLMIDGHAPVESVELKEAQIPDPNVLKTELKKKADEKAAGRKYKINLKEVPLVAGYSADHKVMYPTSGFYELETNVKGKLLLYNNAVNPVEEDAVEVV